jgi:amidase
VTVYRASDEEIAWISVAELGRRIREREMSVSEVLESTIERIERRNPSLNAFVYKGYDDARKAAAAAEDVLRSGREVGPLHGVPIAIKDLFDFKPGWPATFGGIRALANQVLDFYCLFAERMEAAGAVVVGKTNSPVMGLRGTCDNYLFGPSRNPFDTSRNTGGSSGGSAAAVADGLVPLAEGTDGGGSIRIPAAWCGVYGYKASFGRVPLSMRPNAFGGTSPFIFEGTLTRNVEDAALGLTVLAGPDSRDPLSLLDSPDFRGALDRSISGWKIAYSPDLDVFPVEEAVASTVRSALPAFEEAGASVEQVRLGIRRSQRELSDVWTRLIMPLNISGIEGLKAAGIDLLKDHSDDLPPEYRRWLEVGYGMSVMDVWEDHVARTEVYDALESVLARFDLLVTPTLACMPVKNSNDGNTVGPREINGVEVDPLIGWCMTYFANFSGHPAASIPAGRHDGLPVGLQIIGRRGADVDVLAASAAFERERPWQAMYQACAQRSL